VRNVFRTSPSVGQSGAELDELYPPIDWHQLWADDDEDEWIVDPLIPARRLIAIYSAPKVGKSLLMLEVAVAISRGTPVLGAHLDRPRRVLYVDYENDPRGDIRARLQNMHLKPGDLDNLVYLSFPALPGLDTAQGGRTLLDLAQHHRCELVIVDTVSRAVDGEENSNDTWLSLFKHCGLPAKRVGLAIVRLDHSGKDETKGTRGGSAKSGDVDAVWRLTKVNEQTYRLRCEDSRMLIPVQDRTLTLHRHGDPLRHDVDPRGAAAAWDTEIRDRVRALDEAGTPAAAGRDTIRAALTELWSGTGRKVGSNELLAKVASERQQLSALSAESQQPHLSGETADRQRTGVTPYLSAEPPPPRGAEAGGQDRQPGREPQQRDSPAQGDPGYCLRCGRDYEDGTCPHCDRAGT
jgi:hypothetical protein